MTQVQGLHHVTAISGPPQANLTFYRDVLGMRFVKKTVNFDDPSVYHLYYGDEIGRPGSALTFFPWAQLPRGRRGVGEVSETQFAVPAGSLEWWAQHLESAGVTSERSVRFDAPLLRFVDPDGLGLALVEAPDDQRPGWSAPGFDGVAIRGFHGVTLELGDVAPTAALLTGLMDYEAADREGSLERLSAPAGSAARFVDLNASSDAPASQGVGSVHHVAFAVADRAAQLAVRERLLDAGFAVTPPIDRDYFHAIYFRSPGGVLFEVATNEPGFTVDEPAETLGSELKLPKQHAHLRARLEHVLPELV